MERERLTRLLDEPGRVASEDLVGLRALTERYPWFSGAHLLLAVGEHASGDVLFDDRLRTVAANVPSRAVVYDLVQPFDGPAPTRRATPPDAGPMRLPSVATERPLDFEDHAPAPAEAVAPIAIAPPAPEPPGIEEFPVAASPQPPSDPLDQQILEAAYAQAYDLTWKEQVPPAPPVSGSTPVSEPGPERSAEQPVKPPVAFEPSSRFRFSEWLDLSPPPPPMAVTVARVQAVPDRIPTPVPTGTADKTLPTTEVVTSDVHGLIDRFIEGQVPPPQRKAEFFTPQQAAKRSLEDHVDLVTVTLARIYEQQGNLTKAAQAYRNLAGRTPERAAEFLALAMALEARQGKG